MATSCLRPRLLSSRSDLQMRQCSKWCSLLSQQCGVRGHSSAVSELRSCPALPNFGLVYAVII